MQHPDWLSRTELMLGEESLKKIRKSNVLVVGLGGVGAYAAEQICRAGVGKMTLVDGDYIIDSNINRQLPATHSTVGEPKAEVLAKRFKDINPDIKLTVISEFIHDEKMGEILQEDFDYVVDAIDTISPKAYLIYHSIKRKLKIISSMGAGGKSDPTQVKIADISKTHYCKLARTIRKRLYSLGIRKGFKVVFSPEEINKEGVKLLKNEQNKKSTVGTISYMPAIFGCFCASVVIRDLAEVKH